jgi:hypothetical protein
MGLAHSRLTIDFTCHNKDQPEKSLASITVPRASNFETLRRSAGNRVDAIRGRILYCTVRYDMDWGYDEERGHLSRAIDDCMITVVRFKEVFLFLLSCVVTEYDGCMVESAFRLPGDLKHISDLSLSLSLSHALVSSAPREHTVYRMPA